MKAWVFCLLFLHGMAGAAERPQDYAFGMAIHTDTEAALYELEIPLGVYRGVTRADVGDLRVFNGRDEVVPHALRPRVEMTEQAGGEIALPVFPLYGDAKGKIEDIRVRVKKLADGTIIAIQSRALGVAGTSRLGGYLLDASALKSIVRALKLDWRRDNHSFVGKVNVDGSDDLARWINLADNAAVARLIFDGHRVERNRVELRPAKLKYLRISWPANQAALEDLRVGAEAVANLMPAPRTWQKISGSAVAGPGGGYGYDLGGYIPVDRLRIELPEVNSLVQLQIHSRAKPSDPWRPRRSAVAYRLRDHDTEVTSPEIAVTTASDRYWLLRVDQRGGGVGSDLPTLQVGWVAQKLVFAARGTGPFQLAFGNSRSKPAAFAIESLIPGYKTDAEFKVQPATLGEQFTLAGPAPLGAPLDYRRLALWGSLIVGVGLLGWMASRLMRQVSKPPADR